MSFDTSSTTKNMSQSLLETISDADNLFSAYKEARRGSSWKTAVQKYGYNKLREINNLRKDLLAGKYKQRQFYEFILSERGKIRPIRSQCIRDRILQRTLCDNALIPYLRPQLIYDNGASLKNKGIDFSKNRLKCHLEKFLRHHDGGYVLLIDFSKFFDNIPHEKLLELINTKLKDRSLNPILKQMLDSFCPDVSYMSDYDFKTMKKPFDSVEHRKKRREYTGPKGEKVLHRSLGIGSQMSQISGVFYPSSIDNYFKCVLGLKYYGRYMDDVYIIHESKEYLKNLLEKFYEQAERLHLYVNRKKTQIVNLKDGFVYLKMNYHIEGKKIKVRPNKLTFRRERRRLKKFKRLFDRGNMTLKMISDSYQSWRGTVLRYKNCSRNIAYTDKIYKELFCEE